MARFPWGKPTLTAANEHDSEHLERALDSIRSIQRRHGRPYRRPTNLHVDEELGEELDARAGPDGDDRGCIVGDCARRPLGDLPLRHPRDTERREWRRGGSHRRRAIRGTTGKSREARWPYRARTSRCPGPVPSLRVPLADFQPGSPEPSPARAATGPLVSLAIPPKLELGAPRSTEGAKGAPSAAPDKLHPREKFE